MKKGKTGRAGYNGPPSTSKRATGTHTGMGKSRTKPAGGYSQSTGNTMVADGNKATGTKSVMPGNPKTGMGTPKGKAKPYAQAGKPGEHQEGRARTRKGMNQTGSGMQGFRG